MAWENVIIGYKIIKFREEEIIPLDCEFLFQEDVCVGKSGFVSNLQPVYKKAYYYQVPVYGKKNVKRKAITKS